MSRRQTRDLRRQRDAERENRRSARNARYRPTRMPWWIAAVLDRMSPGLLLVLMLALVVIGGLLGARAALQNREAELARGKPVSSEPVSYDGLVSERWGTKLSPMLEQRYARYGVPLHVGPRGVPLLQNPETGAVRELTELEMDFPHDAESLPVPGVSGVVYAPGGTGHGVRWREPAKLQDLPKLRSVDRMTWFQEQDLLLRDAIRDVKMAMAQVAHAPASSWDRHWAEGLQATAQAINKKYAGGDPEQWKFAGYVIRCDPQLDRDYRAGLTQGCPSPEYRDAVAQVWVHLGELVEIMRRLAESELLESNRRFLRHYEDADIDGYQQRQVENMVKAAGDVRAAVERLRVYGDAEGDYIHVTFD